MSDRDTEALDWALMFRAFGDVAERLFDAAAGAAHRYPVEVAAVERTRRFVRARGAGRRAHLKIDDLLFTFALVLVAVERDGLYQTEYRLAA